MKFYKYPKFPARVTTPRRLGCAERSLKKERDKYPLLADWIAEQQPTALERVESFNTASVVRQRCNRNRQAQKWREMRSLIFALPENERKKVIQDWNESPYPKDPAYLSEFLRKRGHLK